MAVRLMQGDITAFPADAIVNAANSGLLGGGGVDGAIHRAGGPAILAECRLIRRDLLPEGLPTGQAVATTAGNLPARWVIHTVGPIYSGSQSDAELLASAHRTSIALARELGARSIAFPAISTGVYGYPIELAAPIALAAAQAAEDLEITFVLFSAAAHAAFRAACSTGQGQV
ncbi:MAG TPA: O-acetyl-ADP-ribose deacetylase [Motilibacterales bacterium]|nr:O-acetyl-ADP-ribose deacetylase [Motilibacterales bacterium]